MLGGVQAQIAGFDVADEVGRPGRDGARIASVAGLTETNYVPE